MQHYAAFHLGLVCASTHLGVSSVQMVKTGDCPLGLKFTPITRYMVMFSFKLMAIVCVIANLFVFLLAKSDITVH